MKKALWKAVYEVDPIGASRLDLHATMPLAKVAAFDEGDGKAPPFGGGKGIAPGTPGNRNIPKGHEYDPKALKPLAKMLWAMSVSMGHALTAYRQFTKLKSSAISPDGMLGGRGYVMDVRDVRKKLYEACEALSMISDTIHDEINAPHWKPKLEQLTKGEGEDVRRYVDKAEEVLDEAEEVADGVDEMMPANSTDDPTTDKDESAGSPMEEGDEEGDDDEPGSELPDGGDPETTEGFHKHKVKKPGKRKSKTAADVAAMSASLGRIRTKLAIEMSLLREESPEIGVVANSSLPVTTLPGPRVDHLDRGDQQGPFGSYNRDEQPSQNNYDNRFRDNETDKISTSNTPGALTDTTETNADDFGLGGGQNGRSGEGLSHSPAPANGKGVWGPAAQLPSDPGQPTKDPEGVGGESIEVSLQSRDPMLASDKLRGQPRIAVILDDAWAPNAAAVLPNDQDGEVARSDYYPGGGNTVSETMLPGDHTTAPTETDRGDPSSVSTVTEPDKTTPYVKYDPAVHQYAPDNSYSYARPKTARTQNDG